MDKQYATNLNTHYDYQDAASAWKNSAVRAIGIREILALLIRRRYFICLFVLINSALVAIAVASMRDTYTATSAMVLERNNSQMLEAVTELDTEQRDRSAVETEMDIISSRVFAGRVVDATNLIEHPWFNTYLAAKDEDGGSLPGRTFATAKRAFFGLLGVDKSDEPKEPPSKSVQHDRAVTSLLNRLSVTRSGDSFAVTVRVSTPDPELSATLANTVANIYVEWSRELRKQTMSDAVNFLRDRANQVASRIAENERAIADFTRLNQLASDDRDDLVRKRIDEMNTQLTGARVQLGEVRAKREQGRRVIAGAADLEGSALESPLLITLRGERAALVRQRAQYASNFAAGHPQIVETDAQLSSVNAMIDAEISRIVGDLSGEETIVSDRVRQIESQISDLQAMLNQRSLAEIRLRELERDLLADQKLHDLVVARLGGLGPFAEIAKPSARVVSVAEVPTEPSFPQRGRIFGGGVVGATILAMILAVMLEASDIRIWSTRRLSQVAQLPNLAGIPRVSRPLLAFQPQGLGRGASKTHSASAEAYRSLYLACRAQLALPKAVVLVTAPLAKHGTTSVAFGLALSAARDGVRTLYVSLHAEAPAIAAAQGGQTERTAERPFDRGDDPTTVIRSVPGFPRLELLAWPRPRGHQVMAVAESEGLRQLFEKLRGTYDLIVIDAAPVLLVEDANWLSPLVDGILLVVRFGRTTEPELVGAISRLSINRAPLIGTVLNCIDPRTRPIGEPLGAAGYPRQARAYFVNN